MTKRVGVSVVLIVAGFAAGVRMSGWVRAAETSRASEPTPMVATADQRPAPSPAAPAAAPTPAFAAGGPDFTRVASQTVKGVANISSLQVVRQRNSPFTNDPFFRYFFGDDEMFGSRDRRSLSLGSGVIISADGYVVTNNHVARENGRE